MTKARKKFLKLLNEKRTGIIHFGKYKCSHNAVSKYESLKIRS